MWGSVGGPTRGPQDESGVRGPGSGLKLPVPHLRRFGKRNVPPAHLPVPGATQPEVAASPGRVVRSTTLRTTGKRLGGGRIGAPARAWRDTARSGCVTRGGRRLYGAEDDREEAAGRPHRCSCPGLARHRQEWLCPQIGGAIMLPDVRVRTGYRALPRGSPAPTGRTNKAQANGLGLVFGPSLTVNPMFILPEARKGRDTSPRHNRCLGGNCHCFVLSGLGGRRAFC